MKVYGGSAATLSPRALDQNEAFATLKSFNLLKSVMFERGPAGLVSL
jgi:hypothetical protein